MLNLTDVEINENSNKVIFKYSDLVKIFDWPKNVLIEIIGGDLYKPSFRSLYQHEITARLNFIMRGFAFNKRLGSVFPSPFEVVLSEEDVVLPSIFFVSSKKKDIIDINRVMGPPELIIEVFENASSNYINLKKKLYEKYKVNEYLAINATKKSIEHYILPKKKALKSIYAKHCTYKNSDSIILKSMKELEIKLKEIFYSNVKL